MSLIIPQAGDAAASYIAAIAADLQAIDAHDHTTGKGTPIPSAALNINGPLPFGGNSAQALRSAQFANQSALLTATADDRSLFVFNGDLYYLNGSGAVVQISSGSSLHDLSAGFGFYGDYAAYQAQAQYAHSTKQYTLLDETGTQAVLNILGLIAGSSGISSAGGISGSSLNCGAGAITGGAATLASVSASGAVSGGSLSCGSGTITGGAVNASGAISGASLNCGSGTIQGGSIYGTGGYRYPLPYLSLVGTTFTANSTNLTMSFVQQLLYNCSIVGLSVELVGGTLNGTLSFKAISGSTTTPSVSAGTGTTWSRGTYAATTANGITFSYTTSSSYSYSGTVIITVYVQEN